MKMILIETASDQTFLIGEGGGHFGSKHLLINITSKEDYFHSEVFMIEPNFKMENLSF